MSKGTLSWNAFPSLTRRGMRLPRIGGKHYVGHHTSHKNLHGRWPRGELISAHWPLPNALASEECIHEICKHPCVCIACVRRFMREQYRKTGSGGSTGRPTDSNTRRGSARGNGYSAGQSHNGGQGRAWQKAVFRHAAFENRQYVL